jgi:hypothetical protein
MVVQHLNFRIPSGVFGTEFWLMMSYEGEGMRERSHSLVKKRSLVTRPRMSNLWVVGVNAREAVSAEGGLAVV